MKTFSFIKNQKFFFAIVAVVFVIGIVSFFMNGFNVDIDFVGGTEITYDINKTITKDDEAAIEKAVVGAIGAENFSSLKVSGENVIVRTLILETEADTENTEAVNSVAEYRERITAAITALYDNTEELGTQVGTKVAELFPSAVLADNSTATSKVFTLATGDIDKEGNAVLYTWTDEDKESLQTAIADLGKVSVSETELVIDFEGVSSVEWLSTDSVSAEISEGLRNSAITATVVAVVLMLIYIAFRFQISSAFAAVVCLAHDLFVMIVAYSLFQIPVNSTIIAALLTILGYSINATIIIFDRIRENDRKFTDGKGFSSKVDDGIRCTLLRSLNTTLTTLFTIGMIYIMGVTSIKNFALPLIVGIVAGLFSSVCLAGPLWRIFKKLGKKLRNR